MRQQGIPTREAVIDLAHKLVSGEADAIEVARWAQKFHYQDKERGALPSIKAIEKEDPLLGEFIGDLVLADAINEKGELLYTKQDIQGWLDEFLQKVQAEKN